MPCFRHFFPRWPALTLAGLASLAAAASAQTGPTPGVSATAAELTGAWRSAFDGYRSFADVPVAPWRDVNDTVGRIGGWRAYAREAAQPATATVPALSPAPSVPPGIPKAPAVTVHQH